jgi:hypothetical protein
MNWLYIVWGIGVDFFQIHVHSCADMQLPVLVYSYDRRSKTYVFESCMRFNVLSSRSPVVLTCGSGLALLVENVELMKEVMKAPALVLRNGNNVRILNCAGEDAPSCVSFGPR